MDALFGKSVKNSQLFFRSKNDDENFASMGAFYASWTGQFRDAIDIEMVKAYSPAGVQNSCWDQNLLDILWVKKDTFFSFSSFLFENKTENKWIEAKKKKP